MLHVNFYEDIIMDMHTIEIKLSKTKLFFLLAAAALFVALGYWIIMNSEGSSYKHNSLIVKIAGVAGMLFFGTAFIYALIKLFAKKPGLIINEKGITDNASGVSAGFIAWNEITAIKTQQVKSTRFLLIHTKDNDKYLEGKNKLKANMMRMNAKMYGTPISISATTLQYNFKELETLILKNWEAYK